MYLPIPSQPDCASAWREAVRAVDNRPGHSAYNVIIDIADPIANATSADTRVAVVDEFLSDCDKSVETVANTDIDLYDALSWADLQNISDAILEAE